VTLALRLLLAFGLVAIFATAAVGLPLRDASRRAIEAEFETRIVSAEKGMRLQLGYEAATLEGLLDPLCGHDTIVDHALLDLEKARGDVTVFDPDRRVVYPPLVKDQAEAFKVDELYLVTGDGVILGDADGKRLGMRDPRLAAALKAPPHSAPVLRPGGAGVEASMEVHCQKTSSGVTIGLVGSRRIAGVLKRVGDVYGVALRVADPKRPAATTVDTEEKLIPVPEVLGLEVVASVPRAPLFVALRKLDESLALSGAIALGIAILAAVVLARSLSRPIVALARETREVVTGQPRNVQGRGGRELVQLADAFNRTINELSSMRRRLAATERIAAQREVARQIAHEIKNPLAPIRAAVETLRRLRAREDPAFDGYFDEATTTVLEEVHRISNIVTEFTKFARLPAPNPEPIDLAAVARGVVTLHGMATDGAGAKSARVELIAEPLPKVLADKDQMVQVLTNLVQNGLDAASAVRDDPRVVVTLAKNTDEGVRIIVRDNGPGVPEEFIPRLFQPYATTKEKGTGLGLAIVQRIVFEHGGEIVYRTATKGGAVFEIVLPVSGPPLLEKPSVESTGPRG